MRAPRNPFSEHLRRAASWTALSLGLLAVVMAWEPGVAAQGLRQQKAKIELTADRTAYEPGQTVRLAAVMTIDEGYHTNSHEPTYDWLIPTVLDLDLPQGWGEPEVRYPSGEMKAFAFTEEPISVYEGAVRLLVTFNLPEDVGIGTEPAVQASLRYQACDDHSCLPPVTTDARLTLTLGSGGEPTAAELFAATPSQTLEASAGPGEPPGSGAGAQGRASWAILLLAVLGGLILNAMPCVLPVLSLKVFSLIRSADQGRSHVVTGGLATSLGILVSFWALAGAAVGARAAGAAVGWGTQFQHPGFVTFLAVVVLLFCLNLWGLFEIPLPQRLARVGSAGPNEGVLGHFASGLFATLMATPCSAPFLGTAVGFALTQPAAMIFATFTAVGFGMALPYLILAVVPGAARIFPKPGAWMENVRTIMGFLLAGAAVWLLYVLANQVSPERLAVIELGLLALALFVWMGSRMATGAAARRAAAVGVVAAVVGTLALAAQPDAGRAAAAAGGHGGLIEWVAFDHAQALSLAEEGNLVFVDVTADWCLTCKANERLVLETEEIAGAFDLHDVVAMKADWTSRDDTIGAFLAEFGKAGIPFYVLYRPGGEPHVFSELLTKDSVLSVLRDSGETGLAARLDG
jgi:suppressor for copper-sensitivity B